MPVSRGKRGARCHFLLDTGAQLSIINKEFVENKVGVCLSPPMSRLVSSFGMPTAIREGFNYTAGLTLPCGTKTFCIFFAMEGFSLSIQVHKLSTVIQSMNDHDYVAFPDFPRVKGEDIKIFGIIGNDILRCFNQFSLEKAYMFGKRGCGVVKVDNGYLPYGSGINCMPPNVKCKYNDRILGSNDKIVVGNDSDLCKTKNQNVTVSESSKIVKDGDLYGGETRIFYNSAIVTETANQGIETMQKESVSFTSHKKQKESVSFTPLKKLGKERLVVNFAVNTVGYQFDPLQEIFF